MCDNFLYLWVCLYPSSLSLFLSFLVSRFPKSLSLSVSLSHSFVSGFHGQLWWKFAPLMREEKEETSWTKNMGRRLFKLLLWRRSPHPLLTCLPTSSPPPSHPPSNRRRWQFKSKVPPWRGISCSVDSAGRGATRVRL